MQPLLAKPNAEGQDQGRVGAGDIERGFDAADRAKGDRLDAVYWKIDRRIIPAFWLLYFLCSAIRSNVGLAQTMNEAEGHDLAHVLHLSPKQVSTALALFYVAYVVFDLPSNLVMTRLSPRVWMSRIVVAAGLTGSFFAAATNAWSLYLLRFLLGVVTAGMWPGMAYYLTLFYPPSRTAKRIGMYFTAAQASAAVVGLVSSGFQKMDGLGGMVGFQWMFLLYGLCAIALGLGLLWWLPDRLPVPGQKMDDSRLAKWLPTSRPVLTGEDALIHQRDLTRLCRPQRWNVSDLLTVLLDWHLWPLVLMYFGVVGLGIGIQLYGNVIISSINPNFSSISISLLFAPIWIMDLFAILLITPLSDRYHHHRGLFFTASALVQISGLLTTTFAGPLAIWPRYAGLLLIGFGLGPSVPICMAWTGDIFQARHGDVGVAAASALVSGLGNIGSIVTTYALYTGWPADAAPGPLQYRMSNLIMVAILALSIASSLVLTLLLSMSRSTVTRAR